MKLEHSLTPCIKLSIQLIKDVGLDILNLLDEILSDINHRNTFFDP